MYQDASCTAKHPPHQYHEVKVLTNHFSYFHQDYGLGPSDQNLLDCIRPFV